MAVRVTRRAVGALCALSALAGLGGLGGLVPAAEAATAPHSRISPGALMVTTVGPADTTACTAAFVMRNTTTTFVAYAAHCAVPVQAQHRTGCDYETLPLGASVQLHGTDGALAHGRLAYSSWRTMREVGETDTDRCRYNDFALVAVDPTDVDLLDPTVPGTGGPTGLRRDAPPRFERVLSLQPYTTRPVLKDGVTLGTRGNGWSHRVDVSPPASLGDSGSGMLDADGRAFGVLATRYLDRLASSGVTDLPRALAYAQRHGGVGEVELVPGRLPFDPPPRPIPVPEPESAVQAAGR